jgi:hypothetical protein
LLVAPWITAAAGSNLCQGQSFSALCSHILARRNTLDLALFNEVSEAYLAQKAMNLVTQIAPQMVSETYLALLAVTASTASGGVDSLIYRINYFCDIYVLTFPAQAITATGAAHAGDELPAPEFGKQLLQIGQ